jgi:Xanthine and CO dehydrogenases maturation factor, XdhC/CoxF family
MKLDPETVHRRIAELLQLRKRFVVTTITEVKGSAPQRPGARMIVYEDGSFEFTIGGGTFEAEVLRDAQAALRNDTVVHHEYRLTKADLGMYCQGLVNVMFETYLPLPQLLIFGGGHVGQALSKVAAATELFRISVIDDRPEFASAEKHPFADEVILTDRDFQRDVPAVDPESYVVIVTRCHATDQLLVERYLQHDSGYLGLIGSRAKIRQFVRELQQQGMPAERMEKLHAPIGLPIGGKAPSEIAISILAEIIQEKNVRSKSEDALPLQIKNRQK